MIRICGPTIDELYASCLKKILMSKEVSPRGYKTKEELGCCLTLWHAQNSFIQLPQRRLNLYLILGEWLWMLRGSNRLDEVLFYNKFWKHVSDDAETLNGAYGKRLFDYPIDNLDFNVNQLQAVIDELKRDLSSRRAVISFWDPADLILDGTKLSSDIPCNITFQYLVRDGGLHAISYCRSNDIIKGFANDIPHFVLFQMLIAASLDIKVASYTHFVGSFHLYEDDYNFAELMVKEYEKVQVHPLFYVHESNSKAHIPLTQIDLKKKNLEELITVVSAVEEQIRESSISSMGIDLDIVRSYSDWFAEALAVIACLRFIKNKDWISFTSMQGNVSIPLFQKFLDRSWEKKAIR